MLFVVNDEYIEWKFKHDIWFQKWWKIIEINAIIIDKNYEKSHFRWSEKNNKSIIWSNFFQLTHVLNDRFKIRCNYCHVINEHSITYLNFNTSNLLKHLKTKKCNDKKNEQTQKRSNVSYVDRINQSWIIQKNNAYLIILQKKNKNVIKNDFDQQKFDAKLIKTFVKFNWFYRTIDDSSIRNLFIMIRFDIWFSHRIKLISMIKFNFVKIQKKIKFDFEKSQRIFIVLNEWFNFQNFVFLKMLMYWMNAKFQYCERLIEFVFFLVEHTNRQLMRKLLKILSFYEIRNKFFDVVIDNVNNNKTLKKKLEKAMIFHNFSWNRKQNVIFCFAHVVNLMIQNFIKIIDFEIVNNSTFTSLKNDQIEDVEKSNDLSQMIKKIKLNW